MAKDTVAQRRLETLLDEAEARGSCLVPHTRADDAVLKRRLAVNEVVEPARGVYARPSYWLGLTPDVRALHLMRGLGEKHPSWIFRSSSALLVEGLDLPYALALPVRVYATRAPARSCGNVDVKVLHAPLRPDLVETRRGLSVVTFWEALLECLLDISFPNGLAVADAAVRRFGWDADQLVSFVRAEGRHRPGIRRAVIIASFADGRAEDGGESLARAFLIMHGFQLPLLQVEIPDVTNPGRVFRVDFLWELPDGRIVVGEFDGRCKYVDEGMLDGCSTVDVLLSERQRESRLTLAGCSVVRFTYDDLLHPQRLVNLLVSAGIPRDEGAARIWHDRWAAASPHAA